MPRTKSSMSIISGILGSIRSKSRAESVLSVQSAASATSIDRSSSGISSRTASSSSRVQTQSKSSSSSSRPLTENEISEFSNMFNFVDKDQDGLISMQDLEKFLLTLGEKPPKRHLETLFTIGDLNKDGFIDKNEFLILLEKDINSQLTHHSDSREESFKTAFKKFDLDNDGYITRGDLKQALHRMGDTDLSDLEVEMMMIEADRDDKGRVSFEDFRLMMLDGYL